MPSKNVLSRAIHFGALIAPLVIPALGAPELLWSGKMAATIGLMAVSLRLQPAYDVRETTTEDRGTARVFTLLFLALNAGTILEAREGMPQSVELDGVTLLAAMTIAIGLAVRTWAIRTLGRFFTLTVRVTDDQPIITDGPYRYMRHPSYTGAFLMLIGLPIAWRAWYALAACVVCFGFWFFVRIRTEEAVLLKAKGDSYRAYMKAVPALIPGLRRRVRTE